MARLPDSAHTSQPWRIHELTQDFDLEDVWALPTPGGPDDFPRLVDLATGMDPEQETTNPAVRLLWALRWKLGALLGWDDEGAGTGARVPSLAERLPGDLRATARDVEFALPFRPLYQLDNEAAAEIANRTMHGVAHFGWVPDGRGGFRGQMAVLVKRNGRLGSLYMAAIKPFRRLIVYPVMLRDLERAWQRRA